VESSGGSEGLQTDADTNESLTAVGRMQQGKFKKTTNQSETCQGPNPSNPGENSAEKQPIEGLYQVVRDDDTVFLF